MDSNTWQSVTEEFCLVSQISINRDFWIIFLYFLMLNLIFKINCMNVFIITLESMIKIVKTINESTLYFI